MDERTLKLMQDSPTREAIADLGNNASQVDGLDYLRIGADTEAIKAVRLTKTDLTSFKKPPEADEPGTETTRREAWLKIVTMHFTFGYKWRFSTRGERPFWLKWKTQTFKMTSKRER